jgi:C-terminal processing protease CtpA/Prc
VQNLAAFGKVWGFLKYYHPNVAKGKFNWDTTLVSNYQKVILKKDKNEFNLLLLQIINSAGPVPENTEIKTNFADSVKKNLNIGWIYDTTVFVPFIIKKLQYIYDNYKPVSNFYIQRSKYVGNPLFLNEIRYDVPLPSPEYRFLALCRFWNVINYYYPYHYMVSYPWDSLFIEFIPRLINIPSYYLYFRTLQHMTSRINDGHVMVSSTLANLFADRRLLPFKIQKIENMVLVSGFIDSTLSHNAGIKIGDTILSIENFNTELLRKHHMLYQSASNYSYLEGRINFWMSVVKTDPALVFVKKGTDTVKIEVNTLKTPYRVKSDAFKKSFWPLNDSVGYIHLGRLRSAQIDSAFIQLGDKPYLIIDCRYYPNWTIYPLSEKLLTKRYIIAQITEPDYRNPGIIKWVKPMYAGKTNTNHYKGTILALINEETMSQGELTVMAIMKAPKCVTIGMRTAGACGDISDLPLPGGIEVTFSGLGYYFSDYSNLQQNGIVPDIAVNPTIKGIISGKDEIMERAFEFIRDGK